MVFANNKETTRTNGLPHKINKNRVHCHQGAKNSTRTLVDPSTTPLKVLLSRLTTAEKVCKKKRQQHKQSEKYKKKEDVECF